MTIWYIYIYIKKKPTYEIDSFYPLYMHSSCILFLSHFNPMVRSITVRRITKYNDFISCINHATLKLFICKKKKYIYKTDVEKSRWKNTKLADTCSYKILLNVTLDVALFTTFVGVFVVIKMVIDILYTL